MPFHIQRVRIVFGGILLSLILAGCGANPQTSTPTNPVPSATTAPPQPVPSTTTVPPQPVPSATSAPAPTQSVSNPTTAPTQVPTTMTLVPTLVRTSQTLPPAMVPTSPGAPITGEIPAAILATMLADLSQRAGVATNEISIQVSEAVTWPDGSLGCPQPNLMYPQVLIDGYRAILVANGREYAYHSDTRGNAFYCAQPAR